MQTASREELKAGLLYFGETEKVIDIYLEAQELTKMFAVAGKKIEQR